MDRKNNLIDFENGMIVIEGEVIKPKYNFTDFCDSPFYKHQDGIKIIYLDGKKEIDGHFYIVSFFFRERKLYMISLFCCDKEYTPETEYERKKLHDAILSEYNIPNEKEFYWGKVTSGYDRKGNVSSINLTYYDG